MNLPIGFLQGGTIVTARSEEWHHLKIESRGVYQLTSLLLAVFSTGKAKLGETE